MPVKITSQPIRLELFRIRIQNIQNLSLAELIGWLSSVCDCLNVYILQAASGTHLENTHLGKPKHYSAFCPSVA